MSKSKKDRSVAYAQEEQTKLKQQEFIRQYNEYKVAYEPDVIRTKLERNTQN
jgi:hypothetical protein